MKKISIILSVLVALVSCNSNSQNDYQRYHVKSGIVTYNTTISGKVLGGKVSGSGTASLYFKNWGATEFREENSTQTTTIKFFGKEKKETTSTHTINKLENGKSYNVDFDSKIIYERVDPAMKILQQNNTNATDAGKEMLISMGGQKVGEENYKGYNCEIWDVSGIKQWIYKGVTLKIETTLMGITTVTEADKVSFDVSVNDSYFKLPDFKVQKLDNDMGFDDGDFQNDLKGMELPPYDVWKKEVIANDPEMKNMTEKELKETYEMVKKMMKMGQNN